MKLIYHNHNSDSAPVEGNICSAINGLKNENQIDIMKKPEDSFNIYPKCPDIIWSDTDIVLVHDQDIITFIDDHEGVKIDSAPKEWSVIIAFNSAGVKHSPKKHAFNKNGFVCKFYSFGIHPPQRTPLDVDEWKKVLLFAAELSGQDKTIEQVINSIPKDIKHILCPPHSINHLIALSILCQGYLAAHDVEEFSVSDSGLQKKAVENQEKTEVKDWWKPALGEDYKGKALNEELEARDEEKKDANKAINDLTNIISKDDNAYFDNGKLKDEDCIIAKFTDRVNAAYGQLTVIFGAMK